MTPVHLMLVLGLLASTPGCHGYQVSAVDGEQSPATETPGGAPSIMPPRKAPEAEAGEGSPSVEAPSDEPLGTPSAGGAEEGAADEPGIDADEPATLADCPEVVLHGDIGDDVPYDPSWPPLASVTEVTGYRLVGVTGLSKLRSVGGSFVLRSQWATSLHGLEQLESVGGNLLLNLVHVPSLQALSGLRRIGRSLVIEGALYGDVLVDHQGLEGLTELGGLELFWTHTLTSLRGLPSFTHFTGDLLIEGALSLTSIDALGELRRIDGRLLLDTDPALSDLSAFGKLERTGSLEVVAMPPSTSLVPFSSLQAIEGVLAVSSTALTSLAGLDQLTDLGSLLVSGTDLVELGPLHVSTLRDVGIYETSITSLDGLQELTEVAENVVLRRNLALQSLAGLEALERVGGDFLIDQNPALGGVEALAALREVGGTFGLLELGLTELGPLDALERVGSLQIGGNDSLTELAPLERLELTAGALSVWGNATLSRCDAAALATTLNTSCACQEGSTPTCFPGCHATRLGGLICENCQGLSYCLCEGTCDRTGNDNSAVTCGG